MNFRDHKLWLSLGVAALLPIAAAAEAEAGGFTLRSHSASGFGTALAGVAAGGELSYSYWNPAALSAVPGPQLSGVGSGIFPSFRIRPDAATNAMVDWAGGTPTSSTDIARNALVPASYAAYPVSDRLTLGVAATSPFGLASKAPRNWAGQIYSRDSKISSLNVNPMASYQVSDMLTIGGGVQFQYLRTELTQAVLPHPDAPDASLKASDFGMGFNLGLQFKPWDGTTLGLGYRSSISHSLSGRLAMPGARIPAKARLATPDIVSFGLRQEVTERFRLMGTVEWNNWRRIGKVPVVASESGTLLTVLHLDYRDGWLYSLGAEYDATDQFTLRAGIGYETSPVTAANRDTRLPETDQLMLAAGLTYRHSENLSLDLSYLYSRGRGNGEIGIGPDDPRFVGLPFHATSKLDVSIVSVGLNYRFSAPGW